jgi:hypothetical protein
MKQSPDELVILFESIFTAQEEIASPKNGSQ